MASELAVGFGIAQQMMQQGLAAVRRRRRPCRAVPRPSAGAAPAAAVPTVDLLGVADVAKVLGVSDADVMAVIEAGELKAKKIGTTYRITKAALDSYLAN